MYLEMNEKTGKSHAVLLYNSNSLGNWHVLIMIVFDYMSNLLRSFKIEYMFTPEPSLTLRTIGGVLDFYFVVDETPEMVKELYINSV